MEVQNLRTNIEESNRKLEQLRCELELAKKATLG